jgi:hypothetical protein
MCEQFGFIGMRIHAGYHEKTVHWCDYPLGISWRVAFCADKKKSAERHVGLGTREGIALYCDLVGRLSGPGGLSFMAGETRKAYFALLLLEGGLSMRNPPVIRIIDARYWAEFCHS